MDQLTALQAHYAKNQQMKDRQKAEKKKAEVKQALLNYQTTTLSITSGLPTSTMAAS